MRITIDHKTNHAKTTNLGPLIGLIFFARSSTYRVLKNLVNYRQTYK